MGETPEIPESAPAESIPCAIVERRRYRSSHLIWIVPVLALIIGLSLLVKAYLEKGPVITISFKSGAGIEAGKTKIKYKDVQIGLVRSISIAKDRSNVLVTADIAKSAEPFLKADTRFWVVRPRITGGSISGLETLTAGSYIGMDTGTAQESTAAFTGLDDPPVVTMDVPGRHFVLHADDIGSLSVGSPVMFRHLQVGEVISLELDKEGETIILKVFVRSPYDRFVRKNTLFWHASGLDFKMGADGIKINTESLMSILLGGIAFQDPEEADEEPQAEKDHNFVLFANREEAFKRPDSIVENYRLVFRESVRGLSVGAPVDLRGVTMGEVSRITAELDPATKKVSMAVNIRFYPGRLKTRSKTPSAKPPLSSRPMLEEMVKQGFRAQLRSGSLLTGQLYVALDFFPDAAPAKINWSGYLPELPTTSGMMEQLQSALLRIIQKIEKLPLNELAGDARKTVQTLDQTLKSADSLLKDMDSKLVPEAKQMLEQTRKTMDSASQTLGEVKKTMASDGQLQIDLRDTLRELGRAAQSLRTLAEYLDRHPESLIQGKKEDPR